MDDLGTWVGNVVGVAVLLCVALALHLVIRPIMLRKLDREITESPIRWDDVLSSRRVPARLAGLLPLMVLYIGVGFVPDVDPGFVDGSRRVLQVAVVMCLLLTIFALTRAADEIYITHYADARSRPIKGYLQLMNLVGLGVAAVLIVSSLSGRSPVVILSGIGALMAVLLLVFADSISGLVASVQIRSNDLLHVGDWIEVDGVEGEVIDVMLHSVRVRNSDMTETTLPVRDLVSGTFTNWRAMYESGGRRIMRAIPVDLTTVRFLTDVELDALATRELLHAPLAEHRAALAVDHAREVPQGMLPFRRQITNVGAFRMYAEAYLRRHPSLHHDDRTVLVRPLTPSPNGLPIEVYAFATETSFVGFETVQAEIFDHLLAIIPEFGLRVFQNPTGQDLARMAMPAITADTPRPTVLAASPTSAMSMANVDVTQPHEGSPFGS